MKERLCKNFDTERLQEFQFGHDIEEISQSITCMLMWTP